MEYVARLLVKKKDRNEKIDIFLSASCVADAEKDVARLYKRAKLLSLTRQSYDTTSKKKEKMWWHK